MFSVEFSRLLKEGIRSQWSAELPSEFFEDKLDEMIRYPILGADNVFKRSGEIFLEITPEENDVDDEDVLTKKGKKRSSKHALTINDPPTNALTSSADVNSPVVQDYRSLFPFGLVLQTLQSPCKPFSIWRNEFLAILFHLLKNCHPHKRSEAFYHGEVGVEKWGPNIPFCQQNLEVVRREFLKAMAALEHYVRSIS